MRTFTSMLGGIWQSMIDLFTGIFALIPQYLYFIYTCCASLMDLMQYVVRKLAGLDVYYVNGQKVEGDIIIDFIGGILGINGNSARYSALSTVFWSLIIFGCILLVFTTIITIIKNQYTYDAKKSNPINIVFSAIKTFFLIAIIPLTSIFGIYLSNVLLRAADNITSPASTVQVADVFKNSSVNYTEYFQKGKSSSGYETYASYDFFGATSYTNTPSVSGIMFKVATNSANRVRSTSYEASKSTTMGTENFRWTDFGVFTSTSADANVRQEEVADMIDCAFMNCMTLQKQDINASLLGKDSAVLVSSFTYLESAVWYLGLINVKCFSKFNVGLVWYYYNLWGFNYFLAFAGLGACLTIFTSIFFGLIARMINVLALFLVYPPLVGIGPLDENKAIGKWKTSFIKNILMAYGGILGLNIVFLLLDEMRKVFFFTSSLLNDIFQMVLIIALLAVIKDIIKLISSLVGGDDVNETGKAVKDDVVKLGTKGLDSTMKAANIALKIAGKAHPALRLASLAMDKIEKKKADRDTRIAARKQAIADKEAAEEAAKEARDASKVDTDEFKSIMETEDGSGSAKADIDNFAATKTQEIAKDIHKSFTEKYTAAAAAIDADPSKTNKDAEKAKVRKQLLEEAVDDFSENNVHANRAKPKEEIVVEKEEEIRNIDESLRAEDEANRNKIGRGIDRISNDTARSFLKGVYNVAGQTLKYAGTITGAIDIFNKVDEKTDLVDNAKTIAQTFFQEMNMRSATGKIDRGTSILLTKQQKKDKEKADAKEYRKKLTEAYNYSKRSSAELIDLAREIEKWLARRATGGTSAATPPTTSPTTPPGTSTPPTTSPGTPPVTSSGTGTTSSTGASGTGTTGIASGVSGTSGTGTGTTSSTGVSGIASGVSGTSGSGAGKTSSTGASGIASGVSGKSSRASKGISSGKTLVTPVSTVSAVASSVTSPLGVKPVSDKSEKTSPEKDEIKPVEGDGVPKDTTDESKQEVVKPSSEEKTTEEVSTPSDKSEGETGKDSLNNAQTTSEENNKEEKKEDDESKDESISDIENNIKQLRRSKNDELEKLDKEINEVRAPLLNKEILLEGVEEKRKEYETYLNTHRDTMSQEDIDSYEKAIQDKEKEKQEYNTAIFPMKAKLEDLEREYRDCEKEWVKKINKEKEKLNKSRSSRNDDK